MFDQRPNVDKLWEKEREGDEVMVKKIVILFIMGMAILGVNTGAYAEIFNLSDNGWSVTIDTQRQIRDGEGTATDGLVTWRDPSGYDYVYQDTWFGRSGDATSEGSVSDLNLLSYSTPAPNRILLNFNDPWSQYFDLSYELHGAGASSWIVERLVVTNGGINPLTTSVFKYTDFDLCYNYTAHDDDYAFGNTSGITQYDAFSTTSVIPAGSSIPDAFQISRAGYPGSVISSLNDSSMTNLNNLGSPFGPGDVDFAFQWNLTLEPNQAYTIENTKTITTTVPAAVPEPATILLLGPALGILAMRRKKIIS